MPLKIFLYTCNVLIQFPLNLLISLTLIRRLDDVTLTLQASTNLWDLPFRTSAAEKCFPTGGTRTTYDQRFIIFVGLQFLVIVIYIAIFRSEFPFTDQILRVEHY
jgi:hypothetical protein